MLARFLHFLALDGAERSFQQLAYLTCKNADLKKLACKVERPLVLRIAFDGNDENKTFVLPFHQSIMVNYGFRYPNYRLSSTEKIGQKRNQSPNVLQILLLRKIFEAPDEVNSTASTGNDKTQILQLK
jgi:hypothetical protein